MVVSENENCVIYFLTVILYIYIYMCVLWCHLSWDRNGRIRGKKKEKTRSSLKLTILFYLEVCI